MISSAELAKISRHYRNKLIFGYSWRADIVAAMEAGAKNANQAAKMVGYSYEPAKKK